MASHPIRCCLILLTLVTCSWAHCSPRQTKTPPKRTLPGDAGFPAEQLFKDLEAKLNGSTVTRNNSWYKEATSMYNTRVEERPYRVYYVLSVEDVQKIVEFAKKYNLRMSVRSSGHSFIGRSTNNDGIIIDLAKLKGRSIKLNSTRNPAGEITVQSGNSWIEVYKEVDGIVTTDAQGNRQRRVVVGGSAHSVAMGGYTQGGGHSPISRKLGLAVDNLLEATIVLADGRKAVVNDQGTTITDLQGQTTTTTDTSLFWAIRGGGGGPWGVVIDFTFKLHYAPQRFRNTGASFALYYKGGDIGTAMMKYVIKELVGLSSDWGGYILVTMDQLSADAKGSLSAFLNHFGSNSSASNADVNRLIEYDPLKARFNPYDNYYDTFLEYEQNAKDPAEVNAYIYNTFIEFPTDVSEDDERLEKLVAFLMNMRNKPTDDSRYDCTATMIGGKMKEVPDGSTPVNPKFRSGLLSMSCSLSWPVGQERDDFYIRHALIMRDELAKLGEGSYYNEPAEDLDDWKVQFWGNGSNYQRLVDIKKKWDPDNFLWCHNCVGSDLSYGGTGGKGDAATGGGSPLLLSSPSWMLWSLAAVVNVGVMLAGF